MKAVGVSLSSRARFAPAFTLNLIVFFIAVVIQQLREPDTNGFC